MSYATQADMVERFGFEELAQRTSRTDGLAIDVVVLSRALMDADAEINGYLAARYALPLSSTPAVLVRLAADLARYQLCGDKVPANVRQRYEDAAAMLKRLARGEVQLDGITVVTAAGGSGNAVAARLPAKVFGPGQLQSY